MENLIANRMKNVPKSFIREILKVASSPNIISFAGGLPNPKFFPVKEIQEACNKILLEDGQNVLQYSTSEGYIPLRKYIIENFKKINKTEINLEETLITSGSQQGLDLIGKTLINKGDNIIIERPGYLGAIQAFSVYEPNFLSVSLEENGVNLKELEELLKNNKVKFFYGIPNFQNPSGITYSEDKRIKLAKILKKYDVLFIEDNPYGELRFLGSHLKSMKYYYENCILLGTFSKTVSPSFRIAWISANKTILDKILIAKQATDLHTNYFGQRVIYQYLKDNDINKHIEKIKEAYGRQRKIMLEAIKEYFPKEIKYTSPEGGMFLWVSLEKGISSKKLFDKAIKKNVAFVPGFPFYFDNAEENTLRLNYSNLDEKKIKEGIKILGKLM